MTNAPTNQTEARTRQALRTELLYKAGDIRTLALDYPDQAALLIALGDMIDAGAALLGVIDGGGLDDCVNRLAV